MPDCLTWLALDGMWQMGMLYLCIIAIFLLTRFKPPRKDD